MNYLGSIGLKRSNPICIICAMSQGNLTLWRLGSNLEVRGYCPNCDCISATVILKPIEGGEYNNEC